MGGARLSYQCDGLGGSNEADAMKGGERGEREGLLKLAAAFLRAAQRPLKRFLTLSLYLENKQ